MGANGGLRNQNSMKSQLWPIPCDSDIDLLLFASSFLGANCSMTHTEHIVNILKIKDFGIDNNGDK